MVRQLSLLLASAGTLAVVPPAAAETIDLSENAGGYRVELQVLPPEPIYTPEQLASDRAKSGMVARGGAAPVAVDAPSHPNHQLVVHVFDAKTGQPLTDANVGLYFEAFNNDGKLIQNLTSVPVVEMQAVGKGAESTGYGNNVRLTSGQYRISATVNGMDLTFFTDIG